VADGQRGLKQGSQSEALAYQGAADCVAADFVKGM
jgi:hypothetical protein